MSCGVGQRRGLDPALLWLRCRLAAIAPIGLPAWEPPYALGVPLKSKKKKEKEKEKEKEKKICWNVIDLECCVSFRCTAK